MTQVKLGMKWRRPHVIETRGSFFPLKMLFQVLANKKNGHRRIFFTTITHALNEGDWTVILSPYINTEILGNYSSLHSHAIRELFLNPARDIQ